MESTVSSYQLALAAGQRVKEREYWLDKLSGPLVKSNIPYDFKGETLNGNEADRDRPVEQINVSASLLARVMELCQGKNPEIKIHMILVTALLVLLSKYTGHDDIIVGSPLLKQPRETDFINTVLVFRNRVREEIGFKDLLLQVRETIIQANKNQNFPVEKIIDRLDLSHKDKDSPLFDVVILLDNLYDKRFIRHGTYNLCFTFSWNNHSLEGEVEYNSRLYRSGTIKRVIRHYMQLLTEALAHLETPLSHLSLLSGEEKKQLLMDFNDTAFEDSGTKPLHRLFAEQAARTPDKIAVTRANPLATLSYSHLNRQALRLSRRLSAQGLQPGNIAALLTRPSIEMITGILGILMAGAAYLPIEPDDPGTRTDFMLKDSAVKIAVTDMDEVKTCDMIKQKIAAGHLELIDCRVEKGTGNREELPSALPAALQDGPAAPAYVLYTSGTTGRPKGVMAEHRNVTAYLQAFYREFPLSGQETALQLVSYTFDIFVEELYPVLLRGGKFILTDVLARLDAGVLTRCIARHAVNIIDCTPLQLNELNRYAAENPGDNSLQTVQTFISGGDVLRKAYVDHLLKIGTVYNTYGPTETTVCAAYYNCSHPGSESAVERDTVLIGKPIGNYRVYILDKYHLLVPVGVTAELYISGPGVTRGYLNQPELTAEKFLGGLFSRKPPPCTPRKSFLLNSLLITHRQSLVYKTGDLARWLPEGIIEFIGRSDHQVKIRGYRIELGEIENRLLTYDKIKEAVVIVETDENGDKHLTAYIAAGSPLEINELKEYLSLSLPYYMIPAFFIQVEQIPLTTAGKVDRQALARQGRILQTAVPYTPPGSDTEKLIAAAWEDILDIRKPGVLDNFFDIGGNSFSIIRVNTRLKETMHREISMASMFRYPTIRSLAQYLDSEEQEETIAISDEKIDRSLSIMEETSRLLLGETDD